MESLRGMGLAIGQLFESRLQASHSNWMIGLAQENGLRMREAREKIQS